MNQLYKNLSKLTIKWGEIQAENESEKALVTSSEWATWLAFNERAVKLLEKFIDEYDTFNGRLSDESARQLEWLQQQIASAKHMSKEELTQRATTKASELFQNFKR